MDRRGFRLERRPGPDFHLCLWPGEGERESAGPCRRRWEADNEDGDGDEDEEDENRDE